MVNFNLQRTLSESYSTIPESLVVSCAVDFAQIANKHSNELNYTALRITVGHRTFVLK